MSGSVLRKCGKGCDVCCPVPTIGTIPAPKYAVRMGFESGTDVIEHNILDVKIASDRARQIIIDVQSNDGVTKFPSKPVDVSVIRQWEHTAEILWTFTF